LFFSLIMPLVLLFIYLGLLARGHRDAIPYLLADVLALTVMGSFWGLSAQLVTFREQGILRRFRVAPISASAMLASSIISNYILTIPTIVIEFYLSRKVFHMSGMGNLIGVAVLLTLGIVTFATLGLVIASVTNTMQETQIINQILWFAFLFLSGATVPFPSLLAAVQRVSYFLLATYLVSGLQQSMSAINPVGLSGLGLNLASMIGCTIIAFVVAAQLFRWEPEAKAPRRAKLWAAGAIIPFLLLGIWENKYEHVLARSITDYQLIERTSPSEMPAH